MHSQLHFTNAPTLSETYWIPIQNSDWHPQKPIGGLWTSSETEAGESEWTKHANELQGETKDNVYVVVPKDSVRIYTIDTCEDLRKILNRFPRGDYLDFEGIAREYDGIHITERGIEVTRNDSAVKDWDVESTIWFTWCFERVE